MQAFWDAASSDPVGCATPRSTLLGMSVADLRVIQMVEHLIREQVTYHTSANAKSNQLNVLIFQLVEPCGVLGIPLLQI